MVASKRYIESPSDLYQQQQQQQQKGKGSSDVNEIIVEHWSIPMTS